MVSVTHQHTATRPLNYQQKEAQMNSDHKTSDAEIIKTASEIDLIPVLPGDGVQKDKMSKIPFTEFSALGIAASGLVDAFRTASQTTSTSSGEQLYRLDMRGLTGSVQQLSDGSGNLSGVMGDKGIIGHAAYVPVESQTATSKLVLPYNPASAFMAVALISIDKKLEAVQTTQKEIVNFLIMEKKAELRGNLNVLNDIWEGLKANFDNELYMESRHNEVLEIRRSAESNIEFERGQIKEAFATKDPFQNKRKVDEKIEKAKLWLGEYQIALYLFGYSTLLDLILLGNFGEDYLEQVKTKLEKYADDYQATYDEVFEQIESDSESLLGSKVIGGAAELTKMAGEALSKTPLGENTPIDTALLDASDSLGDFNDKMLKQTTNNLLERCENCILPFIDSITVVNKLYNQQGVCFIDEENMYLLPQ